MTAGDSADLEQALRKALGSDVRFDAMTRRLYATDASIYSIDPIGVVYPRSADDVVAIVDIARRFHVPYRAAVARASPARPSVTQSCSTSRSTCTGSWRSIPRRGRRACSRVSYKTN